MLPQSASRFAPAEYGGRVEFLPLTRGRLGGGCLPGCIVAVRHRPRRHSYFLNVSADTQTTPTLPPRVQGEGSLGPRRLVGSTVRTAFRETTLLGARALIVSLKAWGFRFDAECADVYHSARSPGHRALRTLSDSIVKMLAHLILFDQSASQHQR